MVVLGAIIGAGFASGKEIVSFFGKSGYLAIPFFLVVGGLFLFFFYVFCKLGKMIRPRSISDLTNAMFGRFGVAVDFGFILSSFITLSSMLAGCDSVGLLVFGENYNFCYVSILTAMLVCVIVFFGLKYVYKITNIISTITVSMILLVIVLFMFSSNIETVSSTNLNFNFISTLIFSVLYVSMNTFSNIFIVSKSSEYMDKKQIGLANGISSGVIMLIITLILLSVMKGGDAIFTSDMPIVSMAFSISGVLGNVYSIVLWLAIFTTICVTAYTIVEWLNKYIKNKFICSVIVLTLGFIFSRFGFSTIVDVFYPIEGVFGAVFIIFSIIYYFKNKSIYEKEQKILLNHLESMDNILKKENLNFTANELDYTKVKNISQREVNAHKEKKQRRISNLNDTDLKSEKNDDLKGLTVEKKNGEVVIKKIKKRSKT